MAITLVLGIGQAMAFASLYTVAGLGVAPGRQGVASATMSTAQQVGTALGFAVLLGVAAFAAPATYGTDPTATATGLQAALWAGTAALVVAAGGAWFSLKRT